MQLIAEYFTQYLSLSQALLLACAAVFAVLAFGASFRGGRAVACSILKMVFMAALLLALHLCLYVLAYYVPEIRTPYLWGALILGYLLYGACFCRYKRPYRAVTGFAFCALAIVFGALGEAAEEAMRLFVPAFPAEVAGIAAAVLFAVCAALCVRFSLTRYPLTAGMAGLNIAVSALSALLAVGYELLTDYLLGDAAEAAPFAAAVWAVLIAVLLAAYFAAYRHSKRDEEHFSALAEELLRGAVRDRQYLAARSLDELRGIGTDIRGRYLRVRSLLEQRKYQELTDEFMQVTLPPPQFGHIDCGNRCIDAVLDMERAKAEGAGVAADIQVSVPAVLPFAEDDLVFLLATVIDGAIAACARSIKKHIEACLDIQGDYLHLRTVSPAFAGRAVLDSENAGELSAEDGMRIVHRIVCKYHGMYRGGEEDGSYVFELILDMYQK